MPRILVIEDQDDLAALYEKTLTEAGFTVQNAYSGEEGVAEFAASGADAILLDMTLPEMNGVAVLTEIRRADTSVPIIVITGETSDETRAQCQRLGVFDYLPKPVDYPVLLSSLRRALHPQQPDDDAYEVVTLRLPARVVECLSQVDTNLERALTELCDSGAFSRARAASE